MAFLETENVKIIGLSACVPKNSEENSELSIISAEEIEKLITSTGIERRRKTYPGVCTSDLCYEAAERLISDLNWNKEEIDCLIFVTQGPDYILPATSCILQDRLELSEECYTLDISLGCSGWVYGLSVIGSLLSGGKMKKGLLLSGDISWMNSPKDKTTYPLFGDAGTATAVVFADQAKGFQFHLGTDGSGHQAIMVLDGGLRNPPTPTSTVMEEVEPGVVRCRLNTILDGMDVFAFGIDKVPKSVQELMSHYSLEEDQTDYFVFHQANLFLNERIRKKLLLPKEKVPYSLKDFGNTSSATIPLTLITELRDTLQNGKKNIVACGFGVGFSWGTVHLEIDKIVISHLIEI